MLNGKVALITGAGRGIGKSVSELFAKNGARLGLNFNRSRKNAEAMAEEIRQSGGEAIAIQADVRKRDQVAAMFKQIKKTFGRIDILVNNAGVLNDNLMIMTKEGDYDAILDVNLKGTFNCTQFAAKAMLNKGGKIINLSSIVGRYGNEGQVAYAASKAGVIGITTSAAKEFGQFGITVNAVAPGLIDTEMITALKPEKKEKLIEATALKRIGKPMDVAKVILFLASDLSDYVSGQIIGVDGCQVL